MSIKVNVKSADLKRALDKLASAMQKGLETAVSEGADVIAEIATGDAPGPHIETEKLDSSPTRVAYAIGFDKQFWYYLFFETGTRPHSVSRQTAKALKLYGLNAFSLTADVGGMAARPFLRPALDSGATKAAAAIGQSLMRQAGL